MAYLKYTIVDSTLQVKEKIETVNLETQSISIVGGGVRKPFKNVLSSWQSN